MPKDIDNAIRERLEYLRGELRAAGADYGRVLLALADLERLASYIDPDDTELLAAVSPLEFLEADE